MALALGLGLLCPYRCGHGEPQVHAAVGAVGRCRPSPCSEHRQAGPGSPPSPPALLCLLPSRPTFFPSLTLGHPEVFLCWFFPSDRAPSGEGWVLRPACVPLGTQHGGHTVAASASCCFSCLLEGGSRGSSVVRGLLLSGMEPPRPGRARGNGVLGVLRAGAAPWLPVQRGCFQPAWWLCGDAGPAGS